MPELVDGTRRHPDHLAVEHRRACAAQPLAQAPARSPRAAPRARLPCRGRDRKVGDRAIHARKASLVASTKHVATVRPTRPGARAGPPLRFAHARDGHAHRRGGDPGRPLCRQVARTPPAHADVGQGESCCHAVHPLDRSVRNRYLDVRRQRRAPHRRPSRRWAPRRPRRWRSLRVLELQLLERVRRRRLRRRWVIPPPRPAQSPARTPSSSRRCDP